MVDVDIEKLITKMNERITSYRGQIEALNKARTRARKGDIARFEVEVKSLLEDESGKSICHKGKKGESLEKVIGNAVIAFGVANGKTKKDAATIDINDPELVSKLQAEINKYVVFADLRFKL